MDTEQKRPEESKVLKTKCNGCIFLNGKYESKCDLEKPINKLETLYYCKGFCNQKREMKWLKNLDEKNIHWNDVLDKENSTLSLVISCLNKDLKKLSHTLSFTNFDMFCDVTISIQSDKEDSKESLEKLTKLIVEKIPPGTKWNLDSLIYKTPLEKLQGENYSSRLCGGSWIVFMVAGDFLGRTEYVHFRENIEDRKNSMVMFDLGLKMIINRNCYLAMNGHLDFSFQEKLKQFDNYSECCKEIK